MRGSAVRMSVNTTPSRATFAICLQSPDLKMSVREIDGRWGPQWTTDPARAHGSVKRCARFAPQPWSLPFRSVVGRRHCAVSCQTASQIGARGSNLVVLASIIPFLGSGREASRISR